MSSTFKFEHEHDGRYRVKDQFGYIGVVTGKPGSWCAESGGVQLAKPSRTLALAAHALRQRRSR